MATRVTYNDIVLTNVLIREFRQEVVYDPSRTDSLFSRYTITVEGLITDYATGSRPHVSDRHARRQACNDWLRTVRVALAEPRRALRIEQVEWCDGQERAETILYCAPAVGAYQDEPYRDLSNGPKPIDLQVRAFLGTHAIKIVWTVQCDLLQPPMSQDQSFLDNFQGVQAVLVNRWSVAEEFDENLFCTRTISGSLRMSSPAARTGFDYRWLAVPGLEAGFKRQRMRYAVQPDGLEVQYEIQDRQWHTMPPWPCTDMRVRHQRSTNYGVTAIAVCDVQLAGPPYAPKTALLCRLAQILDFYLGIVSRAKDYGQTWSIRQADIIEEVGPENRVSARIDIQILGAPQKSGDTSNDFITQHLLNVGRDLDLRGQPDPAIPGHQPPGPYSPMIAQMPSPFGYNTWGGERHPGVIALFQCYLQRPYRPPHGMANWPAPQPGPSEKAPHDKQTQVERVPPEQLQTQRRQDKYSDQHKQHLYTYVRMKNAYRIDQMKVGCPQVVAEKSDNGNTQSKAKTTHVVQLARPTVRRTVSYDAERLGTWPELPKPVDYDLPSGSKAVLAQYSICPYPPTTSATGEGLVYRVQGRYQWILEEPVQENTSWAISHLPHVKDETQGFVPCFDKRIGPT